MIEGVHNRGHRVEVRYRRGPVPTNPIVNVNGASPDDGDAALVLGSAQPAVPFKVA